MFFNDLLSIFCAESFLIIIATACIYIVFDSFEKYFQICLSTWSKVEPSEGNEACIITISHVRKMSRTVLLVHTANRNNYSLFKARFQIQKLSLDFIFQELTLRTKIEVVVKITVVKRKQDFGKHILLTLWYHIVSAELIVHWHTEKQL